MKVQKIIYWIATGLFSAMMLFSVFLYVAKHEMAVEMFKILGYPSYVVYLLALAKLLGVTAILTKRSQVLKEWAYAGFFFNMVLGIGAHLAIADGGQYMLVGAMVLMFTSYFMEKKAFAATTETKLQMQGA